MKKLQRIFSLLVVLAMLAALAVPAMAEDAGQTTNTTTITITDAKEGETYAAYQLAVLASASGDNYAYEMNGKYREAVLTGVRAAGTDYADKTDDQTQDYWDAHLMQEMEKFDAEQTRTFADAVYRYILEHDLEADATAEGGKFQNVECGYYLIAETVTEDADDTHSLVLVQTADLNGVNVAQKEDIPSLILKVQEDSNSEWQDAADHDVESMVPFRMTATLPKTTDDYDYLASYDTYGIVFHNTLATSLNFDSTSVKVYAGEQEVSTGYYTIKTTTSDGCAFEVEIQDVKAMISNLQLQASGLEIRVEFKARLNDTAALGSGNIGNTDTTNTSIAYLTYSSSPYDDAETNQTAKDLVRVFSYQLIVNKLRQGPDKTQEALSGATFALYRGEGTDEENLVKQIENPDGNIFTFSGLDAGTYTLKEIAAPEGYHLADDVTFTITGTYDTDSSDPQLTELTTDKTDGTAGNFTPELTNGSVTKNVLNFTGSKLPSTGGIGTTLFYLFGGALAVGAGVLLVVKFRMGREK